MPPTRVRRLCFAMLSAAVVSLAPGIAFGGSKVRIAAIGDEAPGGGLFAGPALTGAPAAAGNGWIAFRTRVTDGGTAEQIVGTNLDPSKPERFEVASLGRPAGALGNRDLGTFKQFLGRPTINAKGDVAFVALLTESEALPGGIEHFLDPPPAAVFLCRHTGSGLCQLSAVAVSRTEFAGLGALDFTFLVNFLEESSSIDTLERTPGLNDDGDVVFTASTLDGADANAAIFLATAGGSGPVPVLRTGDAFGDRAFDAFGAPAINNHGVVAFRGSVEGDGAIFTLADGTVTRLVREFQELPVATETLTMSAESFGDIVLLNDAGDVVAVAGGLRDLFNLGSLEGEFGVVLCPRDGTLPRLVSYPGLPILGFGRITGGSLGPEGGGKPGLPGLAQDAAVYFFAELSGGHGQAFFRAAPPDYRPGLPLVVFGGPQPDPSPVGGFYGAAGSGPAVDAVGNLAFFARLAGAPASEALILRPASGNAGSILVGEPTPRGGYFAGPPFASPLINDADVVVFKSYIAQGPSALGIFRWRPEDSGNGLSALVRTGDPSPLDGSPLIVDLPGDPSLNRSGDLAFTALVEGGQRVIMKLSNGLLTRIAGRFDPVPALDPQAEIDSIAASPLILADSSVVFRANVVRPDPLDPLSLTRDEALLRVDPSGTTSVLAVTSDPSPTGTKFFRFRDPSTSGGMNIAFRAPLGNRATAVDANVLPTGIFVVGPDTAISAVAVQDQPLADGQVVRGLTGRPGVDANGAVAFLARLDKGGTALLTQSAAGVRTVAQLGQRCPEGGIYRSLSRPFVSSSGDVAFRAGFEPFTGGASGHFLADATGVRSLVQVGESGPADLGGQIISLNPSAALNSSDHLAFIAGLTGSKARNALLVAGPATAKVRQLGVRIGGRSGRDVVRGSMTLQPGSFADPIRLAEDAVSLVVRDAERTLVTASIGKRGLVRRGKGYAPKRHPKALRKLRLRLDRDKNVRVSFRTAPDDLTFGGLLLLQPPFTIRVDVGGSSATAVLDCDVSRRRVACPARGR